MVPKRGVRGYYTASSFFSVKIAFAIMRDVKVLLSLDNSKVAVILKIATQYQGGNLQ